ncbi:hypothetical protein A0H81_13209 [Grifola frondosa]|uniref:Uncharacterized protein n=1 Tax=Grifola frondosa TaxID=5627 RepID=A0A1C7LRQ7_GRIFR|nr:hypothetical protein A0H81_13209 [Grifola frondosa]
MCDIRDQGDVHRGFVVFEAFEAFEDGNINFETIDDFGQFDCGHDDPVCGSAKEQEYGTEKHTRDPIEEAVTGATKDYNKRARARLHVTRSAPSRGTASASQSRVPTSAPKTTTNVGLGPRDYVEAKAISSNQWPEQAM